MSMYHELVSEDGEVVEVRNTGWRRRGPYGYIDVFADVGEYSMTKQEFRDECDINNIMATYQKTGLVGHINKYGGRYEDVSGAVSFQEAQEIVRRAEEMFMTVPSSLRAKFDNNPGAFLEFVMNDANYEEVHKMGLMKEELYELKSKAASSVDAGQPDGPVAGADPGRGAAGSK